MLHACFGEVILGAAENSATASTSAWTSQSEDTETHKLAVHTISSCDKDMVLLCTSAVKVINPSTGAWTIAYTKNNTALKLRSFRKT